MITEKMQLIVKKFHNRRRCISLNISQSVLFGREHFFGMPRRYPKFPVGILAASLRAKNANTFFGLRKAQSLMDYAILLALVAIAFSTMGKYVTGAMYKRFHGVHQELNESQRGK